MSDELVGFHPDKSNEDYHSSEGYSASDSVMMAEGFDYWRWKKSQPNEQTEAMALGSATHLLLEARLKNDLSIFLNGTATKPGAPEGTLITNADFKAKCKELELPVSGTNAELMARLRKAKPSLIFWEDIEREFGISSKGKLLLTPEDRGQVERMVDTVMGDPYVMGFFQGGVCEPSIYIRCPVTGLLRKCRPDYLRAEEGLLINFKTTRPDISFERQAAIMAYDWASSYYCDVAREHFGRSFDEIHISVTTNKEGPCRLSVDTIDDDDLQFAEAQWRPLLARIRECEISGIWPAPPVKLRSARIPNFARRLNPYV